LPIHWRKILPNDTLSGLQFFQLFRYGSVFLIGIVLPRAGLLPDQVGVFEAFLFFAGVVSYFWLTGLIQAFLPLASGSGLEPKGNMPDSAFEEKSAYRKTPTGFQITRQLSMEFFNSFILLLIFSVISALALLLASPMLGRLLGQELPPEMIWLVILYLVLFAPSTLVEYWYVITDQTKSLVRFGIIAYTLQIVLVGLPVVLGYGVPGAIWGMITAGSFRLIWLIVILARNREFRISWPFWGKYLSLGTPIILSVLLSGSAQYVNGFIVSIKFDPATFAIFRYGARELPLVALLAHALSNAMVPVISREGPAAGMKILRERSSRMASWMFPLSIVLVLSAYFIFPAVYTPNYLESAGVFNLFLLLITSRLLFPQTILIALKRTRILMIASFLELILNVGLSLVLVQIWGIRGVALATVIAYYFERAFLMTYARVAMGIPASHYMDIRRHLTWTAVLLAAFLLAELVIYPLVRG